MPYANFVRLLEAGRVERVVVRQERAVVTLKPPQADRIEVRLPGPQGTPDGALIGQLQAQGVDYRFEAPGAWFGLLLNLLPFAPLLLVPLGLVAALIVVLRRHSRSAQP